MNKKKKPQTQVLVNQNKMSPYKESKKLLYVT